MMVGDTVADLGTPVVDGTMGVVRVGAGGDAHDELLTWFLSPGVWIGKPKLTMKMVDVETGFRKAGSGWVYMSSVASLDSLVADQTGFGFGIRHVPRFKELYDAGLRLQEHLTGLYSGAASGSVSQTAFNWYYIDEGEVFLSPTPTNQGVILAGDASDFEHQLFHASGWQHSALDSPATNYEGGSGGSKRMGYPNLYSYNVEAAPFDLHKLVARHRWVGYDGAGGGSDGSAARPPIWDKLVQWHCADFINLADGAAISCWNDFAGFNGGGGVTNFARHLLQATGSKQPLLIKSVVNGHAVVRFDGVNDVLTRASPALAAPLTVFLVMKQPATGSTQQVWYGNGASGSPLFYRDNAAGKINLWTGGSDITYDTGDWPTPFMVFSTQHANGAGSNIWENKVLKVTGNAGTGGIGGLSIGAEYNSTLPSTIDVAEVLVYAKLLNDTDRNLVIDWLNSKYALF